MMILIIIYSVVIIYFITRSVKRKIQLLVNCLIITVLYLYLAKNFLL